jgi:hypothetical protein
LTGFRPRTTLAEIIDRVAVYLSEKQQARLVAAS